MRGETGQVSTHSLAATKKRARETDAAPCLVLVPHVCRFCFGRVAQVAADAVPVDLSGSPLHRFVCTSCGAAAEGAAPSVLCCCGLTARLPGRGPELYDAGIRCVPNLSPTPEFPAEIVAVAEKP